MKTIEEIKSNKKLQKILDMGGTLAGEIHISWTGSFVCGFNEQGWEHVSVAPFNKKIVPSWEDMCKVKEIFWNDEEECVQIHPAKSVYVNLKENCLHIWRKVGGMELPTGKEEKWQK